MQLFFFVCTSSPSAILPRVQHSGKIFFPECPIFGTQGSTWHSGNIASPVVRSRNNKGGPACAMHRPSKQPRAFGLFCLPVGATTRTRTGYRLPSGIFGFGEWRFFIKKIQRKMNELANVILHHYSKFDMQKKFVQHTTKR
jgi:hypothetical protein